MPLGQPGSSRSTRPPGADQAVDVPVRTTLEVLFYESTVLWASATALLGEEGRLSYGDLMVRAQNVAAVLRRKGMRHGDLVGVVGLRTFSSIAGILGILLAGGVYVPFDVQGQSTEKLARQVDESAIRLYGDRLQRRGGRPAAVGAPSHDHRRIDPGARVHAALPGGEAAAPIAGRSGGGDLQCSRDTAFW